MAHFSSRSHCVFFSLAFALCSLIAATSTHAAPAIDYNRDVRPILSENCFACHGFDEASRAANLRLDMAESATADRGGYAAIAPGDLQSSALWDRINSVDESLVMPPPDSRRELTAEQKEILRRWISSGAQYAKHWSFIPPVKLPPPAIRDEAWARSEIDRFVRWRLYSAGLMPSPAADRRTLIRRLSLDLTGLPPSADEVEAFVSDRREEAYEQLIDRLLASPHFGERMALEWLDAARYADTNGFSIDGGRHMWLWRDWVINAFNQDLPYDRFLVEQLAGDLLPDRTDAQLIASGFQRNNMVTHEGGTIPEENLVNYNVDRVKTLGEAVLGLTLGCAQCHDHKYDPITQRDYYRLFAYFNAASDVGLDGNGGVNSRPYIEAKSVLETNELPALTERIAALRMALARPDEAGIDAWVDQQRDELLQLGRDMGLNSAELLKVSTPNAGAGFEIEGGKYVNINGASDLVAYDVLMRLPQTGQPISAIRIVFHPSENVPNNGWGYGNLAPSSKVDDSLSVAGRTGEGGEPVPDGTVVNEAGINSRPKGTFVLTYCCASAEAVPGDQVNLNLLRPVVRVTANSWRDGYRPEGILDTRPDEGWSPRIDREGPVHICLTFAEPIDAAQTPYLTAQVNFGAGGPLVAARFEFLAVTGNDDGSELPDDIIAVVKKDKANRTEQERRRLASYFAEYSKTTEPLRIELTNLEERVRVLTEEFPTMVMDVAEQPRDTHILERGNYAAPQEKVSAGTPAFLTPLPEGGPANRLGLAQWIVAPDHPLAARVAVNRIWKMLFGAGIVRTPADFGLQGAWPTHPELLDWLAVDFIESGWKVKTLVRKIVMSSTYRQSSATSEELLLRDPGNHLLARGPRFRLPAEFIRDAALKVSGLWVNRIGGPSVNPYSPGDLWREVSHFGSTPATAQTFVQDHGEKLYRRSLYTYWKRTVPPPNMVAFDAPNRETCVIDRASTTTPLQALVLLNDVQFVEAARAFAQRIIKRDKDDVARLRWAFEECLSRPPSDEEMLVLSDALNRERARYASDESTARKYLASGESPRDESMPASDHAAWSQVAALLMNLSETITRN